MMGHAFLIKGAIEICLYKFVNGQLQKVIQKKY